MELLGGAKRGEAGASARSPRLGRGDGVGHEELVVGDSSWEDGGWGAYGGGYPAGFQGADAYGWEGGWDSAWAGYSDGGDQDMYYSATGSASSKGVGKGAQHDFWYGEPAQGPGEDLTALEIEIPYGLRGSVTGAGGSQIQRMELQTGARMRMDTTRPGRAAVHISGSCAAVRSARAALLECLEAGKSNRKGWAKAQGLDCDLECWRVAAPGETPNTTEVMELPQGAGGSVVGVKGTRIRELTSISQAFIQVEKQEDHDTALISGTPEAVAHAKKLIQDTLDAFNLLQEGDDGSGGGSKMDAIKNPFGRPVSSLRVSEELKGTVMAVVPTLGVWFDVGAVKWGMLLWRDLLGNTYRVGEEVEDIRIKSVDSRTDRFHVLPPRSSVVDDERIEIPYGFTGLFLGDGGNRIAEISKQSGAHLIIDRTHERHFVCISGPEQAVTMAKALVTTLLTGALAGASWDRSGASSCGSKGKGREAKAMLVPRDYVRLPPVAIPALIGKGGMNIVSISARCGAKISIQQREGEEVALLFGGPECVAAAKAEIIQQTGDFLREQAELDAGQGTLEVGLRSCGGAKGKFKGKGRRVQSPRRSSNAAGEEPERHEEMLMETMDLPSGSTPIIVGIRGKRILDLQTQTNASVYIDDSREPHQACITGNPEAIANARARLQDILDSSTSLNLEGKVIRIWKDKGKGRGRGSATENPPDAIVEIPDWSASRLIGKQGARVRELMVQSGAYITLRTRSLPPTVQIFGAPEAVEVAKAMVFDAIERIRAADESFKSGKGQGRGDEVSGPEDGGTEPISLLPSEYAPLQLSPDDIGRVIGKAGINIKEVQARSGARVIIDSNSDPPLAWFSGDPEDVASAKAMMSLIQKGKEDEAFSRGGARKGRGRGRGRYAPRRGEDSAFGPSSSRAPGAYGASNVPEATVRLQRDAAAKIMNGGTALMRRITAKSGAEVQIDLVEGLYQATLSGTWEAVASAKALLSDITGEAGETRPRTELFHSVFQKCDEDNDGRLTLRELRRFAKLAGWLEAENGGWTRDYEDLCGDVGADPAGGIDCESLEALVSDESGRHLSDAKLNSMLDALMIDPSVTEARSVQRSELVKGTFDATSQDGMLLFEELSCWFPRPGAMSWEDCYEAFCEAIGADAALGLNLEQFERFVNDDEHASGACLTDEQLQSVYEAVIERKESGRQGKHGEDALSTGSFTPASEAPAAGGDQPDAEEPGPSRSELIRKVFVLGDSDEDGRLNAEEWDALAEVVGQQPSPSDAPADAQAERLDTPEPPSRVELLGELFEACDADGDGFLGQRELRCFAELALWFDGDDEAWAEEYESLCDEAGADTSSGLQLEVLTKMVDDESVGYCTDKQLRDMIEQLRSGGAEAEVDHEPVLTAEAEVDRETAAEAVSAGEGDVSKEQSSPRTALVAAIFGACDEDGDGRLRRQEMQRFAELALWFEGTEAEWDPEYESICSDVNAEASVGLDLGMFTQAVNDESGGFCTDQQLRCVLADLRKAASSSTPSHAPVTGAGGRPPAEQVAATQSTRSAMVGTIFRLLDTDANGLLQALELRRFGDFTGFTGDDQDWTNAYTSLCAEFGVNPSVGIEKALFVRMVNDTSEETGFCHCTDEELCRLLASLRKEGGTEADGSLWDRQKSPSRMEVCPPPEQSTSRKPEGGAEERATVIDTLFRTLDVDRDGRLSMAEMRPFARCTGFRGGDEEWADEFRVLCREHCQAGAGALGRHAFASLVNDTSEETGCYCTNDEMRDITQWLATFSPRRSQLPGGPASTGAPCPISGGDETVDAGRPQQREFPSRTELVKAVYDALDLDGDGVLSEDEMLRFAFCTGFSGSPQEWVRAFRDLCLEAGGESCTAVDFPIFSGLVDNPSEETGCFCTDSELQQIHGHLTRDDPGQPTLAPAVRATPEASAGAAGMLAQQASAARASLVERAFRLLDTDSDGRLSQQELRRLFEHRGCYFTDSAWTQAYQLVCKIHGGGNASTVDSAAFASLLDDVSEVSGCYCTDEELRSLLGGSRPVPPEPSSVSPETPAASDIEAAQQLFSQVRLEQMDPDPLSLDRPGLVRAVFHLLDADKDGRIDQRALRQIVEHRGCFFSDQDWAVAYGSLMRRQEKHEHELVDLGFFEQLVDEDSQNDCSCSDEELRVILTDMMIASMPAHVDRPMDISPDPLPVPTPVSASGLRQATARHEPAAKGPMGPSPPTMARSELISTVFHKLDADVDGRLQELEVRRVAECTGAFYSDSEWREVYRRICAKCETTGVSGLDLSLFMTLADGQFPDIGLFCSDNELRSLLDLEDAADKRAVHPAAEAPKRCRRAELVSEVFRALDIDNDGVLRLCEVRVLAEHMGYFCSDEDWARLHRRLCSHTEFHPQIPGDSTWDPALFELLISDETEGGCYCSTDDLDSFLSSIPALRSALVIGTERPSAVALVHGVGEQSDDAQDSLQRVGAGVVPPGPSLPSRRGLLHMVFTVLDVDGDKRLNKEQMLTFAQLTGFEGSDEAWAEAYDRLCCENDRDPREGIDEAVLENLVDDESEDCGCYCSTNELGIILDKLRERGYGSSS